MLNAYFMDQHTIDNAHDPCDGLEETCWICLGDAAAAESGSMIAPCLCPRYAHQKCLARWQLQNAGKTYASVPCRSRLEARAAGAMQIFAKIASRGLDIPLKTYHKLLQDEGHSR